MYFILIFLSCFLLSVESQNTGALVNITNADGLRNPKLIYVAFGLDYCGACAKMFFHQAYLKFF